MHVISKALTVCLTIMLAFTIILPARAAWAQSTSEAAKPPSGGPRRQLATIIYTGLGGAVLGLSTLSFYGRPQDKLANIAIGFAVGVIAGTVVVTYNAATNPDDFYGTQQGALGPEAKPFVLDRFVANEAPAIGGSFQILQF